MRAFFRHLTVAAFVVGVSLSPTAAGLNALTHQQNILSQNMEHSEAGHDVTIPVGNGPTGAGFGEHFAWVTNGVDVSLSKIDPRNNQVTATIPLSPAFFPARVITTSGALWVSDCFSDSVLRLNSQTGALEAVIPVGVCPSELGVANGHVFVAHSDDQVMSIDPSTNSVVATIPVRIEPTPDDFNFIGLGVAFGSVWVSTAVSTVVRIDPVQNRVIETIPLGPCCGHVGGFAASPNALWVSGDTFKTSVFRINPRSNRPGCRDPVAVERLSRRHRLSQ